MYRLFVALACFFSVLFRGRLPLSAARYLTPDLAGGSDGARTEPAAPLPPAALVAPAPVAASVTVAAAAAEPRRSTTPAAGFDVVAARAEGALLLLSLLQREGRLVDFLRESLDQHDDAAIGAAARDIHRGCRKVMEDHLRLEPVMPGQEEVTVTVPRGFDPGEVRLIGKLEGEPPFRGILVHHGWRAVDLRLPTLSAGVDRRVLAPAEVRLP